MLDPLLNAGVDKRSIDVYEFLGTEGLTYTYLVRSPFCVRPVKLTHNVPNCGYVISESSETAFYATDTGTLEGISEKDCELYLIEANHGEAELEARAAAKLEAGEYSYESAAAVNHLSKEKALDWLSQNMGPQSKYVFLHRHENREEVNNGGREDAEGIHQDF